ncbi:hypothetical protein [Geodermatophilus amargosae]|uniref:hypothetical protein n=1 Tax=Geodermatophilus amargosae TaxID=1296565 RepID=UPI0034E02118
MTDTSAYGAWNPFMPELTGDLRKGRRLQVRIVPPGGCGTTSRLTVTAAEEGRELAWPGRLGLPACSTACTRSPDAAPGGHRADAARGVPGAPGAPGGASAAPDRGRVRRRTRRGGAGSKASPGGTGHADGDGGRCLNPRRHRADRSPRRRHRPGRPGGPPCGRSPATPEAAHRRQEADPTSPRPPTTPSTTRCSSRASSAGVGRHAGTPALGADVEPPAAAGSTLSGVARSGHARSA